MTLPAFDCPPCPRCAESAGVASADVAKRIAEAMRLTNLTERKDWLIKKLSRGFKQRVGIAQAVVHNPDVVILDEPTVGLDPTQRNEVRNLIKGLAGEHTIILSTHILSEVETTCDRVIIIDKGKIVTDKKLEQEFRFENRPYQFIDVETGETVKVHANQVRESYLSEMHKFDEALKLKCAQYKIDLIEADIHEGYRQVLLPYLIKRQRMQ